MPFGVFIVLIYVSRLKAGYNLCLLFCRRQATVIDKVKHTHKYKPLRPQCVQRIQSYISISPHTLTVIILYRLLNGLT